MLKVSTEGDDKGVEEGDVIHLLDSTSLRKVQQVIITLGRPQDHSEEGNSVHLQGEALELCAGDEP